MNEHNSIYSGAEYLYDYFLFNFRQKIRRRGLKNWFLELIYEIGYQVKYPRFKYLFKIFPEHLNVPADKRQQATQYETANSYMLSKSFRELGKLIQTFENAVFIDIGSGTGRILHGASLNGFKRLIGIELAQELCEICTSNLNVYLPQSIERRIINASIKDVDLNNVIIEMDKHKNIDSFVFFLNNPFTVEVLQVFMDKLDRIQSYDMYIVYIWKQYKDCIIEKGFEVVHEEKINNRFTWDSFRIYCRKNDGN